jgi:hypothetical protein
MHPRTDAVGKITDLYKEGEGQVPYLTFMHVFNDLLRDPMELVPEEPSEELQDKFRAACMAAGMGVVDPEGRADQRVAEFHDKLVPVWKEFLSPQDWHDMESLLQGEALRRRRARRKEEEDSQFDLERPVNDKSSALLARLKLIDSDAAPQQEGAPEAEPVSATGTPRPAQQMVPPAEPEGLYESMSALCRAIREGQIDVVPGDDSGRELGAYRLNTHSVTVKLARASGQTYAVLTADAGLKDISGGEDVMNDIAEGMGFIQMTRQAYMRKQEERVHTLKAMKKKVSLACAVKEDDMKNIGALLNGLHWDMGELLERIDQS